MAEDQPPISRMVVRQIDDNSRWRDTLSLSKNALEGSKHDDGRRKANICQIRKVKRRGKRQNVS